jgi:sugar phosphate isomerase/epimerase
MMYNRREFVKTSATVVAGTAVTSSSLLAAISSYSNIKNVGLQLWSIAKSLEQNFTDTLQMVSQIGYKELELFGPYPFSTEKDKASWSAITEMLGFSQSGYFDHTAKQFKEILDSKGLSTPAMHVGLDTLRNKLGETAEAAHILAQQYAGIAAIPEEERRTLDDYKRMADEFNVIGEKAKALGIRFYYHNHGYGLTEMEGKIPFDIILERTDPSLVFLEMDIFWTTAGGADPIKYLDNNPGRYKLMHVKDMTKRVRFSGDGGNAQQWVELFPYITDAGSGVIDLKTIISHAEKAGLEHFIIENDVITNPKESLTKGYKYLSSLKLTD